MTEIAREDIKHVTTLIANRHGSEMTPDEVLALLKEVKSNVVVNDEPGLLAELREIIKSEKWHGNDASQLNND